MWGKNEKIRSVQFNTRSKEFHLMLSFSNILWPFQFYLGSPFHISLRNTSVFFMTLLPNAKFFSFLWRCFGDGTSNVWFEWEPCQVGHNQLQFLHRIRNKFPLGREATLARTALALVISFLGAFCRQGQAFRGGFGEVFRHASLCCMERERKWVVSGSPNLHPVNH